MELMTRSGGRTNSSSESSDLSIVKSSAGGEIHLLRRKPGRHAAIHSSGQSLISAPQGTEMAPKPIDSPHSLPFKRTISKASLPTKMMRTWPPIMMRLIMMKKTLRWRPSKTFSLLSSRRSLRFRLVKYYLSKLHHMLDFVENLQPDKCVEDECLELLGITFGVSVPA
ncbi:hypothetical protein FVEG_14811 [Fusarium verticillioides 7600]|uniref:Uncharacterized protein n=1 Tax=Gibberella moniliformis (strain M3125 / FGSC 7600) TaxID=334819 RepID=W7LR27_GIBM7|nr:hypothetical protein FVEG_14811 [Fusarium verticillioides 7600]XP_018744111.1 hypothetical protein FVEG_14811 [Fusarium verticillioides 7600]XP_018744112.1 hypothetical protein FVEG_14811 [Fusarium verticillioides 7600]EWG37919.1 hypothetical protein FVEG_14811 [Fusarium verticillioides 7600]EWG37920.1 hypothetical protein FVEG_14811 [Fusarium verticillioides 7600]EWG37921.1 hypothetical protein FVEG_14811 [Fusarium verticillioides 7600]